MSQKTSDQETVAKLWKTIDDYYTYIDLGLIKYMSVGSSAQGDTPVAEQPKPRCKHANTAAPELNITYPTRSGSLSPFAIEGYEMACLKAESDGIRRAQRLLREFPTCKHGGSPKLAFSPEGAAYWECECSGNPEE